MFIFTSPIFLLGLIPWTGMVVYLMRRRKSAAVPFLMLWGTTSAVREPRISLKRLPLYLMMLIVSLLLAVVATVGPAWRGGRSERSISIVLDRGINMSPQTADGYPFRGAVHEAAKQIMARFGPSKVNLISIPGTVESTDTAHWEAIAENLLPTALSTESEVDRAVSDCLDDTPNQPVLVISDRRRTGFRDNEANISPVQDISNIGISLFAARSEPKPSAMIRVRNHSRNSSASIALISGNSRIEKKVTFNSDDDVRDVFIDLPLPISNVLRAEVLNGGEATATHRAWLVRLTVPKLERQTTLPTSIERIVKIYSEAHPADSASPRVSIAAGEFPDNQPAIRIVPSSDRTNDMTPVAITPSPVTVAVSIWPGFADDRQLPPPGFQTIVSRIGKPLVAVRDTPTRQVWVNLNVERWSMSPDFVIFFTNVFDWVGQISSNEYRFQLPTKLGEDWRVIESSQRGDSGLWPGLYGRSDGDVVAINPPDVQWNPPAKMNWAVEWKEVAELKPRHDSIAKSVLLIAIAAGCVGLCLWPRSRTQANSAPISYRPLSSFRQLRIRTSRCDLLSPMEMSIT